MGARQFGDFAGELADLVESAAVRPSFVFENRLPEQRFLQVVEKLAGLGGLVCVVTLLFDSLFLQGVDIGLTVEFADLARIECCGQPRAPLVREGLEGLFVKRRRLDFSFRLAGFGRQLPHALNDLAAAFVTDSHGLDHVGFTHLRGARFDHREAFVGAGDDDVQVTLVDLLVARVEDPFAGDPPDAHGADRIKERDI